MQQFTEHDPIDIREGLKGERVRKTKRVKLMRSFLWWAYTREHKRWTEANNEERLIVHRHFGHARFMFCFATATTLLTYLTFFRRIYNFRSRELLNMKEVSFALRFGVSSLIGVGLGYDMHTKALYDPSLYKVALKYRSYYDTEFQRNFPVVASSAGEATQ